jgi:CSLREA domain-containing protein
MIHRMNSNVRVLIGVLFLLTLLFDAAYAQRTDQNAPLREKRLASDNALVVNSILDTTTAGDANCTLREAIINANADSDLTSGDCPAGSGHDSITFSLPPSSQIVLAGSNCQRSPAG